MLSKSKIIAFRQCPKRLWLATFQPALGRSSSSAEAAFAVGNEIGAIARSLEAAKATSGALFEAAYRADDTLVLADFLVG